MEDKKREPRRHEVELQKGDGGLKQRSVAQVVQIHTVDRRVRVKEIWSRLSEPAMNLIGLKMFQVLGGV